MTAQRHAADLRRSLEDEHKQKVAEAAKDVSRIGKAHGVSEEAMQKITQRLAGIA